MKYEIFTENKNKATVVALTTLVFENATFTETMGLYQGIPEDGLVITLIGNESDRPEVHALAKEIKEANEQDAVLVVETPVIHTLI